MFSVNSKDAALQDRKDALRTTLAAARRGRADVERRAARIANGDHLRLALAGRRCVAGYLPLPSEPLDTAALDALAAVSTVLIPVTVGFAPLDWCRYPGPVRRGSFGIDEPAGERLGPGAIAGVDAVLVPALAVDRHGHRLGRGGGHYDRTLALLDDASTSTPDLIAVLYDGEFLDDVPVGPLDRAVAAVVTPSTGLLRLG